MALPEDFSPWKHLREMLLNSHNLTVQKTFIGTPDNNIETTLGGMKFASIIQDDDTVDMIILRIILFYFIFKGELPTPIYGIPVPEFQAEISFHPQIKLIFKEPWSAFLMENQLTPATAEISFRLMTETSQTMNSSKAKSWALKIKEMFASSGGFQWEKGTKKITYKDLAHGIDFRILAVSEGEAVKVIEKVLELANAPYKEELLGISQNHKNYPTVPATQEVYGKARRKPRARPITHVRFQRAEIAIHGLNHSVVLVDRTGKYDGLV